MKTRTFCGQVAKRLGVAQEVVFSVLTECISYGKEIIAVGDEWRLPGLGKFYCQELPSRNSAGERTLDNTSGKKVKCKFTPFKSAVDAVNEEDLEE